LLEQAVQRQKNDPARRALVAEAEERIRLAQHDVMEMSDEVFVESRDFLRQTDRVLSHTPSDIETFARHRSEIARLTLALARE
jgi:hypothetical protein